ncbi:MAG TPA: hypothetical protein VIV12_17280 [Streptosporangiaceae bacterium]
MRVFFDDAQFDFQTLRLLGSAASGDAEAGEVLSTAARIAPGDFSSWTAQWLATAQRVHRIAGDCRERGHVVSARQAYLRAANYYRAAEFYLHGDPADPRIRQLSREARTCFQAALALGRDEVRTLAVPYEGTTLPGYYYPAAGAAGRAATLVVHTGFDGTQEELRAAALAANARGMHCVTFEGPGQGRSSASRGCRSGRTGRRSSRPCSTTCSRCRAQTRTVSRCWGSASAAISRPGQPRSSTGWLPASPTAASSNGLLTCRPA